MARRSALRKTETHEDCPVAQPQSVTVSPPIALSVGGPVGAMHAQLIERLNAQTPNLAYAPDVFDQITQYISRLAGPVMLVIAVAGLVSLLF